MKCKCGKGHASQVDGMCRYCREKKYCKSQSDCKAYGVKRGEGLDLHKVHTPSGEGQLPLV